MFRKPLTLDLDVRTLFFPESNYHVVPEVVQTSSPDASGFDVVRGEDISFINDIDRQITQVDGLYLETDLNYMLSHGIMPSLVPSISPYDKFQTENLGNKGASTLLSNLETQTSTTTPTTE